MRRAVACALGLLALAPATANAAGLDVRSSRESKWPDRRLVVTLPERQPLTADDLRITENGRPVPDVSLRTGASVEGRGVVLAIDASRSMRGRPIASALVAARRLAAQRDPNIPLGVLFFAREPELVLAPTTDSAKIERALAVGPVLHTGTAIHDAAAAAVRTLREVKATSGTVVMLSDGAESMGTTTSNADLARLSRDASVAVYTVGLRSLDFDALALRDVATATSGRYTQVTRPGALPGLFATIGDRVSSQFVVDYRSPVRAGTKVDTRVEVSSSGLSGDVRYTAPALPGGAAAPKPADAVDSLPVLLLALLAFLAVGMVVLVVLRAPKRSVRDRVADFAGTAPTVAEAAAPMQPERAQREPSKPWRRFCETLELAEVHVPPATLALATAVSTLPLATSLAQRSGHGLLALFAVIVPLGVRAWVQRRLSRRRLLFEEQLPDNLQMLASALRTGQSFSMALATMSEDAPEPSRTEFRRAVADERLGVDLTEALARVGVRMRSRELDYVGVVAGVQRDVGGNSAEVLGRVVDTVRERLRLRRTVRTLTAQSRFGGAIISALPLVLAVGMSALQPDYFDPMFASTAGITLFVMAGLMLVAGWLVIRKIVDLES